MLIDMQLSLPRETKFVAVMRDVAATVLNDLYVPSEACDDIRLAMTEACANAVRHATDGSEYQVRFAIDHDECLIEVIDTGPGFTPVYGQAADGDGEAADALVESGRGLQLIEALVDDLQFIRSDDGTRVRLTKRWHDFGISLPEPVDAG